MYYGEKLNSISHLVGAALALIGLGALLTISIQTRSIGRINTLFSLFHQEKKDINDAVQPWNTRNLTDSSRYAQYCSFPLADPATISQQTCRLPAAALAK